MHNFTAQITYMLYEQYPVFALKSNAAFLTAASSWSQCHLSLLCLRNQVTMSPKHFNDADSNSCPCFPQKPDKVQIPQVVPYKESHRYK